MRIWFSHPRHRVLLQVSKLITQKLLQSDEIFYRRAADSRSKAVDVHTRTCMRPRQLFMIDMKLEFASPALSSQVEISWNLIKLFRLSCSKAATSLCRWAVGDVGEAGKIAVYINHPTYTARVCVYIQYISCSTSHTARVGSVKAFLPYSERRQKMFALPA